MDKQRIREMALAAGFKLKPQPDGTEDLNPYVYDFARALMADAPPAPFAGLPWKWSRYNKANSNLIRIEDAAGKVVISGYCRRDESADAIVSAVNRAAPAAQE
jgi:hypothetical protein